jgi:NAD(P)-dependent dehydrogenase (short-subunit alcohol dehydrogenase family)
MPGNCSPTRALPLAFAQCDTMARRLLSAIVMERPPQKAATALDRYGHVDEVAALVAFVAGPESSYITGANLTVDGGMNA